MTRNTPGIFFAADVSTDLLRPCGTVERKILPCSMPGSRIRCVYSARPVTFSRASSRGTERPIWAPPIGFTDIGDWLRCAAMLARLRPLAKREIAIDMCRRPNYDAYALTQRLRVRNRPWI